MYIYIYISISTRHISGGAVYAVLIAAYRVADPLEGIYYTDEYTHPYVYIYISIYLSIYIYP
jgi:hypothetical protein